MGAVLLIIVHIEGEAPSVFIDGVEAGAAIGVEPQIGIAVMAATVSGAIAGKGCRNGVVCINIRKCIAIDCSYALFIHFHIGDGIAAVRRDGENLVRTLGHSNAAAGADGAAVTGGGGDSEGLRVLLPDNSERRESGTVHIKFDTIGVKFSGYNLRLTGFNGIRHLGLTGNAIFPVQARKVDDLYIQVICVIHCHTVGIWQIDCGAIAGRNPGVAVVGVHQIQVVKVVAVGFAIGQLIQKIRILCLLFQQSLAVRAVVINQQRVVQELDTGDILDLKVFVIVGVERRLIHGSP